MPKNSKGTYYLGRAIKHGILDHEKITEAIIKPKPITAWNYDWTFINAHKGKIDGTDYIYAKMCKYSPKAEVTVIDPEKSEEIIKDEPNLHKATSSFVYIPEFSGLAFLRVSSDIEPTTFMKRFSALINNKYGNFFVKCEVEPIADLRTFSLKLSKLERIFNISAAVSPPNPLFGPLWKDLKEYLEMRSTDKLKINEESGGDKSIATKLPELVKGVSEQTEEKPFLPNHVDIGDAAILMAADGYGSGFVKGTKGGETVSNIRLENCM